MDMHPYSNMHGVASVAVSAADCLAGYHAFNGGWSLAGPMAQPAEDDGHKLPAGPNSNGLVWWGRQTVSGPAAGPLTQLVGWAGRLG